VLLWANLAVYVIWGHMGCAGFNTPRLWGICRQNFYMCLPVGILPHSKVGAAFMASLGLTGYWAMGF